MRVRLLSDRAGPGWYQPAGSEIELPRPDALRLIANRCAESVDFEGATKPPTTEEATIGRKGNKR